MGMLYTTLVFGMGVQWVVASGSILASEVKQWLVTLLHTEWRMVALQASVEDDESVSRLLECRERKHLFDPGG